jgi:cyanophycin synthetase
MPFEQFFLLFASLLSSATTMIEVTTSGIDSFAEWRSWVRQSGLLPVVVIAGSRGKSIVATLLDGILRDAGLSVALWTNQGVAIAGIRQQGELGPWQVVEERLENGSIDIAIREVDWATASTLATQPRLPMLAVTNVCSNREDCIAAGDAKLANAAMPALLTAVVGQGWLVLNGEDLAVSADLAGTSHNRMLVTLGLEAPTIEDHLRHSGNLAWLAEDRMFVTHAGRAHDLGSRQDVAFALDGQANVLIFDALMAASLATVLGIEESSTRDTLQRFYVDPDVAPGSFNLLSTGRSLLILDGAAASWHLRPVLRALRDYHRARLLTVFSGLKGTLREDTDEIGRLLGRISNILIVSDDEPTDAERIALAMDGARRNDVPPMLIPVKSEIEGVRRALGLARPKDIIYVLSDDPAALWNSIKSLGPLVHAGPAAHELKSAPAS